MPPQALAMVPLAAPRALQSSEGLQPGPQSAWRRQALTDAQEEQ
jgi:hypothetical protein